MKCIREAMSIKSYHCESCRSFIRSTDEEDGTTLFTDPRPFGERTDLPACLSACDAQADTRKQG
jgi:hypothetical protein